MCVCVCVCVCVCCGLLRIFFFWKTLVYVLVKSKRVYQYLTLKKLFHSMRFFANPQMLFPPSPPFASKLFFYVNLVLTGIIFLVFFFFFQDALGVGGAKNKVVLVFSTKMWQNILFGRWTQSPRKEDETRAVAGEFVCWGGMNVFQKFPQAKNGCTVENYKREIKNCCP